jgi:adenylate cyclase
VTTPPDLSREELADRAGIDPALVDRLVALHILSPESGDDRFRSADVYRIRLVLACERAGLGAGAVGQAIEAGKLSLSYMDRPNYRWTTLSTKTYRELAEELELPVDLALDVVQSIGHARPDPDDRMREDDADIFRLVRFASTIMDRDAIVRTSRVYVDALRRVADAESTLYDTFLIGAFVDQGFSRREAVDLATQFGAEITPLQETFILTLYRRLQERRWTEYDVEGIETILEEMGLYRRPARPPAFAFVDLAGYTRLTEEWGDQAVARLAAELSEIVDTVARGHRGEPVKWLGDGVMVYFRDPGEAVNGILKIVARAPEVGLPAHAGVAAGPVVFQDGDYYGRTVNMAARIASRAAAGQTLVTREVAELADGGKVRFREIGPVDLKGFSAPVPVYEAAPHAVS